MQSVLAYMMQKKVIAIIRGMEPDVIVPIAKALYRGGIRLVEVTFNQSGNMERTVEAIQTIRAAMPEDLCTGAGTVMSVEQLEMANAAGAEFIISPNTDAAVIKRTKELGRVSMPGAFTPTEIVNAYSFGADIVKLFPAANLGVAYIKAVRAPISHIPLAAVGGVDDKNLKDFLAAGVCGFGIGSNIVNKQLVAEKRYDELAELARKYTCQIEE